MKMDDDPNSVNLAVRPSHAYLDDHPGEWGTPFKACAQYQRLAIAYMPRLQKITPYIAILHFTWLLQFEPFQSGYSEHCKSVDLTTTRKHALEWPLTVSKMMEWLCYVNYRCAVGAMTFQVEVFTGRCMSRDNSTVLHELHQLEVLNGAASRTN